MKTPQIKEDEVRDILRQNGVNEDSVSILAIRGYYLDSMGKVGRNDRRVYDDAMIIVSPDGISSYQANTDPNGWRRGSGTGTNKGMASLASGIHLFGIGKHKGKPAFRQCEPFTVIRDGNPPYRHIGMHAINLHSGGYTSTSSLGCQTIPKSEWNRFRKEMYALLKKFNNPKRKNDWGELVHCFPYVLLEEVDRRRENVVVSSRYL